MTTIITIITTPDDDLLLKLRLMILAGVLSETDIFLDINKMKMLMVFIACIAYFQNPCKMLHKWKNFNWSITDLLLCKINAYLVNISTNTLVFQYDTQISETLGDKYSFRYFKGVTQL